MLLIHALDISKIYLEKEIFHIKDLKIYDKDRVGIVGINGAGKTTLINILSGRLKPDRGSVDIRCNISYISQLDKQDINHLSEEMKKKLKVKNLDDRYLSGGERMRLKIAETFSNNSHIIFADEPTANLDYSGIEFLKENLKNFDGAILLISHDREFLDFLCNKIIEIEEGKINIYNGNYSFYECKKAELFKKHMEQYERYNKEKKKVDVLTAKLQEENKKMTKTTRRHFRMKGDCKKTPDSIMKKRHQKIKNIEKRIKMKEEKEKPKEKDSINIVFNGLNKNTKILIEGKNIFKTFGEKVIFKDTSFQIRNRAKIGLIGDNGSGKTTLLKMILNKEDGIEYQNDLKIAYFSQNLDELEEEDTIFENVTNRDKSLYQRARDILGNLLIKENDVFKKVKVLSGGERVKVSFAKILLQNINLLILDEPTNYLDIPSLEVLEKALKLYEGTVIFVSHDKRFLSNIAMEIMEIKDEKLIHYQGTFNEYLNHKKLLKEYSKKELIEKIMVMENRLTVIVSKLCYKNDETEKKRLDEEYQKLYSQIKVLKDYI